MQNILTFKQTFDPLFQAFVEKRLMIYAELVKDESVLEVLAYANRILLSGGKRIRPFLAYTGYRLIHEEVPESVFRYFFALECFHAFALIHDDIMDYGEHRHGIPTAHIHVAECLQNKKRVGDLSHVGRSQAILLGDLLLSWSNELITKPDSSLLIDDFQNIGKLYTKMIDEVVVGQMLDVDLMTRESADLATIEQKMRLKTAGYTFEKPLQIGAQIAGGSEELLESLGRMGRSLGIGFQIQDDYLDLMQTSQCLEKTVFSDLSDRQHTVFTQWIFDHGTDRQKEELKNSLGTKLTETDRQRITKLFNDSGSFENGRMLMDQYFTEAEHIVNALDLSDSSKQTLHDVISYIRKRTS